MTKMLFQDTSKTPGERARDLLSRLTLREKAGQVNQKLYGFSSYERRGDEILLTEEFQAEVARGGGLGVLYGLYRADPWSGKDFSTGLPGAYARRAYNLVQRYVTGHSRFGIPVLMSSECPHGHQALDGYLLPVNLGMGAAWNPALTREAAALCGRQLKGLGVDLALLSMLDVLRDPRWGRSEECYAEDPYLAARLAKSAVEGCQSTGVPAVAKHFCAQGEGTGGVNASAARIGERELREIHLPPMKACCEAGVKAVMAAYNEIDGVYCHANPRLLRGILREELGFSGFVMADGTALDRLDSLTGSPEGSAALALSAGVDVSLWDNAFTHLEQAVEQGLVTEDLLDEAVLRVLELKFELGLFEHPFLEETEPEAFSYEAYPQSLELARQGAVLLKNDGILPLSPEKLKKLAVIGPNADSLYHQLGDYTPPQREGTGVTLRQGLARLLGENMLRYAPGCPVCGADSAGLEEAVATARDCDAVVLVLGGSSSRFSGARFDVNGAAILDGPVQMDCGEGVDSASLRLPGEQEELARRIFALKKPVITVLIGGRPYALPEIDGASRALVCSFYPGPMGGQALAELLLGRFSPSGRLPVSLPRSVGQLPCSYNPKSSYDSMRYCDEKNTALYPFGYGLSYTRFALTEARFPDPISLTALEAGERVEIRFVLKNEGAMDSFAVPQLFLHDRAASTVRRVRELKDFSRVFLKAGEEHACTLSLGREELALWDADMRFTVEPGEFDLLLEEGGTRLAAGSLTVKA